MCGTAAQVALADEAHAPTFLPKSMHLDRLVRDYGELRQQFVKQHGMEDGLLANHKVAALYVWLLSKVPADELFLFPAGAPADLRRRAMVIMMNAVIVGALELETDRVDETLQDDLEYCLLKEAPANLEWLCFSMHALCCVSGSRTNKRRY